MLACFFGHCHNCSCHIKFAPKRCSQTIFIFVVFPFLLLPMNLYFCLSFLINIILLWCDKMPQMNRATLICISFYFYSASCDESTVSFIIKFDCGKKRYIDGVSAAVWPLDSYASVCINTLLYSYFCKWSIFHSHLLFLPLSRYNVSCQLANYKDFVFNFVWLKFVCSMDRSTTKW